MRPDASIRAPDDRSEPFETLFRAHYAPLCDFVYGYVRSREAAQELIQDLFLRLWELRETSDTAPLTTAYLYTAARNRALRYLRHQRVVARWEERAAREAGVPEGRVDEDLHCREVAEAVQGAIDELPERCRLIFTMSRHQELTYGEIAEVLGISVKTVETQMWRALKSLRAKLAPYLGVALAAVNAVDWGTRLTK